MAKAEKREFPVTPTDCLAQLPEISLGDTAWEDDLELRRAELRHSVLAIAELNPVSEAAMVRAVVKNALGRLPELEE